MVEICTRVIVGVCKIQITYRTLNGPLSSNVAIHRKVCLGIKICARGRHKLS